MTVAEDPEGGVFTRAEPVVGGDGRSGANGHDVRAALGADAGGAAFVVRGDVPDDVAIE